MLFADTFLLPALGSPPAQIVMARDCEQRVEISSSARMLISTSVEELTFSVTGLEPIPDLRGRAFLITASPLSFVVSPGDALYAIGGAGTVFGVVSVIVYDALYDPD